MPLDFFDFEMEELLQLFSKIAAENPSLSGLTVSEYKGKVHSAYCTFNPQHRHRTKKSTTPSVSPLALKEFIAGGEKYLCSDCFDDCDYIEVYGARTEENERCSELPDVLIELEFLVDNPGLKGPLGKMSLKDKINTYAQVQTIASKLFEETYLELGFKRSSLAKIQSSLKTSLGKVKKEELFDYLQANVVDTEEPIADVRNMLSVNAHQTGNTKLLDDALEQLQLALEKIRYDQVHGGQFIIFRNTTRGLQENGLIPEEHTVREVFQRVVMPPQGGCNLWQVPQAIHGYLKAAGYYLHPHVFVDKELSSEELLTMDTVLKSLENWEHPNENMLSAYRTTTALSS